MEPHHFDILGIGAFLVVTIYAVVVLFHVSAPRWAAWLLLAVGLAGLVVDAWIVWQYIL